VLAAPKHRREIDRDGAVPILIGYFVQLPHCDEASVVVHEVDSPKLAATLVDSADDIFLSGHVTAVETRSTALLAYLAHNFFAALGVAADRHDRSAFPCHRPNHCPAEPARRSRHHAGLTGEPCRHPGHDSLG
jgi:hypothetical protein